MARTVLTYGDLDLNDGVNYFLLPGFDPGVDVLTYDELVGSGGGVMQVNVSEAHIIEMYVPLRIQGTSFADLRSKVSALNLKIAAGQQRLVYGPPGATISWGCLRSPRVGFSYEYIDALVAFVDFRPLRVVFA